MQKSIFIFALVCNIALLSESFELKMSDPAVFMAPRLCKCRNKCLMEDSCLAAFWRHLGDGFLCKMMTQENSENIIFTFGVDFLCKGCSTTRENIQSAIDSGAVILENIALKKPTYSSSMYTGHHPSLAVNGLNDGIFAFATATKSETNKWLMVDLLSCYFVSQLGISERSAYQSRAGSIKVYLSKTFNKDDNFDGYPEILQVPGDPSSPSVVYNVSTIRSGRFVVIKQIHRNDYLGISELEVFTPSIQH